MTGVGVDDPDVNLFENYTCKSERNYTQYCNKEVDKLIVEQSQETDVAKRKQIVWEIESKIVEDVARPIISLQPRRHLLASARQGLRAAPQQHLQQLALRGRVAGQVGAAAAPARPGAVNRRAARGSLSGTPLPADAADAVRHVGADLRDAAAGAGQYHRHHLRLGGLRESGPEGQDRAAARPRPADRHAVRHLDLGPGARRPGLRLRVGEAGASTRSCRAFPSRPSWRCWRSSSPCCSACRWA